MRCASSVRVAHKPRTAGGLCVMGEEQERVGCSDHVRATTTTDRSSTKTIPAGVQYAYVARGRWETSGDSVEDLQ